MTEKIAVCPKEDELSSLNEDSIKMQQEWIKVLEMPVASDDKCPQVIVDLITQCWKLDPQERPSLTDIKDTLLELLESSNYDVPKRKQQEEQKQEQEKQQEEEEESTNQ